MNIDQTLTIIEQIDKIQIEARKIDCTTEVGLFAANNINRAAIEIMKTLQLIDKDITPETDGMTEH